MTKSLTETTLIPPNFLDFLKSIIPFIPKEKLPQSSENEWNSS